MKTTMKLVAIMVFVSLTAFTTNNTENSLSSDSDTKYYYSRALTVDYGSYTFWISDIGTTTCNDTYEITTKWHDSFKADGYKVSSSYFPTHVFNSRADAENDRNKRISGLKKNKSTIMYIKAIEHNCD